jgi:hypothetical protein
MRTKVLVIAALVFSGASAEPEGTLVDLSTLATIGEAEWRFTDAVAEAGPDENRTYLVSPDTYGDFKLFVEFWVGPDTNSGLFVRCSNPAEVDPLSCFEINIWDEAPNQDFRTGSIVRVAKPTAHVDTVGRWNTAEIEMRGNSIVTVFNGVETARLENDERAARGHIALQFGGGELVRFRNLRIQVND